MKRTLIVALLNVSFAIVAASGSLIRESSVTGFGCFGMGCCLGYALGRQKDQKTEGDTL